MSDTAHGADVTRADFDEQVLRRSHDVPVVADFWAGWCAPCRMLKPVLEKLAAEYGGKFFLAKIDTDAEQELAQRYGVRSLPTVQIFRDGRPVESFMGALPESQVRSVLERHVPRASDAPVSQALGLHRGGDTARAIALLREALSTDPGSDRVRLALAGLLLAQADADAATLDEAAHLLAGLSPEARNGGQAGQLRAHLELRRLAAAAGDPQTEGLEGRFQRGVRLLLRGDVDEGMEQLLEIVRRNRKFRDDGARKAMLAGFEMLGARDARVRKYQALLARALY
jgi:putative thioredoxin